MIDGRTPQSFASGHLRGSINVSLDGRFAEYAGDVVDPDRPIILVTDPDRESEARTRLARIGFDRTVGYLPDIESVLVEHPEQAQLSKRLLQPTWPPGSTTIPNCNSSMSATPPNTARVPSPAPSWFLSRCCVPVSVT